jgi:hypothetical protein
MPFGSSAVLDNFNRADTNPPPSASWSQGCIQFTASTGIEVSSNTVRRGSLVATYRQGGYWNPATFGPDSEVFFTVPTIPTVDFDGFSLYARLVSIGSGTTDGYAVTVFRNGGVFNNWQIERIDNGVPTTLGAGFTQAIAAGDSVGLEIVGSTLTAYHKPSAGSWTSLTTRTDSTYSAAGNIGLEILGPNERADDFAGGNASVVGVAVTPDYSKFPKAILRRV